MKTEDIVKNILNNNGAADISKINQNGTVEELEEFINHCETLNDEEFLAHYGVKGMKWDVINEVVEKLSSSDKIKYKTLLDRYNKLTNNTNNQSISPSTNVNNTKVSKEKLADSVIDRNKFAQRYVEKLKAENAEKARLKAEEEAGAEYNRRYEHDEQLFRNHQEEYKRLLEYPYKLVEEYAKQRIEEIKKSNETGSKVKHSDLEDDYLAHFGILGQKWGVRRYQNPDGTLTPEGKERYGSPQELENYRQLQENFEKNANNVIGNTSKAFNQMGDLVPNKPGRYENKYKSSYKKTKYSNLSNEELSQRINRLNLENRYADLVGDNKYVKSGQEKARETFQTLGSGVALLGTIVTVGQALRRMNEGSSGTKLLKK